MNSKLHAYCNRLDQSVDAVRHLSKKFSEPLGLTGFAYVRVYHDGRVGWVTSDADHDRLLIEKKALENDPLIDTAQLLKAGRFLWFHDREFPGCESFYRDRTRLFKVDHGLVIVNHCHKYLETGCFSGCLTHRPLYNLFFNEIAIFRRFLEHFKIQMKSAELVGLLEEGLKIDDLKAKERASDLHPSDHSINACLILAEVCGWTDLLKLSPRERECLALLGENYTYREIGSRLQLSSRTIEHYFESIKNKLNLDTRAQLRAAARRYT